MFQIVVVTPGLPTNFDIGVIRVGSLHDFDGNRAEGWGRVAGLMQGGKCLKILG